MINLLPANLKQSYSYARRNVGLRHWIVLCVAALVGLGIIGTYGLFKLQQSNLHYNKQITANQSQLQTQNYDATQAQVEDISNSFKLVVKVLSNEVLFSQLLKQVAATIPNNANLTNLTISQGQAGLDITANATDYTTASQVQVNLADPRNKIFSKADIVSITCNSSSSSDPTYPCSVVIRALFAKDNPYLFINNKAAKP